MPQNRLDFLPALRALVGKYRKLIGRIERVEGRTIIGWAQDRTRPDISLDLRLMVDGKLRETFTASLRRPDVVAAGFLREACGFDIRLPDGLPDGRAHTIAILLPDGRQLRGSPIHLPAKGERTASARDMTALGLAGQVERLGPNEVAGWLLDTGDSDRTVDLCLEVDGKIVLTTSADQERRDVQANGHARRYSGFRFALPPAVMDGGTHLVRVLESESGAILPGGEARLASRLEGVAFLNAEGLSIAGWARPISSVRVRFDDAEPIIAKVGLPVAGLGGERSGFEVTIPPELMDGAWHSAAIMHPATGVPLDGSPVAFRLNPAQRPVIRAARLVGRRFHAVVTDRNGAPLDIAIAVEIDGQRMAVVRSDGTRTKLAPQEDRPRNVLSFALPPRAQRIVLWKDDESDETPLGIWNLLDSGLERESAAPDPTVEISARTLADPDLVVGAQRALEAFCDPSSGDLLFDPVWYGLENMGRPSNRDEAIAHYRDIGVAQGLSPVPTFDEQGVRRYYPALNAAIADGKIPCAFALYLHMGRGLSLNPLPGIDLAGLLAEYGLPHDAPDPLGQLRNAVAAVRPIPPPEPTLVPRLPLPPPTIRRKPADSVYAAWMTRLRTTPEMLDMLHKDEAAVRAWLDATVLMRQPLVSIIMPTYNRAHTLGDAIQSALDQTYANFELLVCDDGSTDKTSEVVKQFDDPRLRYMQFTKSNGAETRNKGLGFAKGEYIAYLDSDNLWNPHFLDLMMRRLLDAPGTSIAYSAYLDTETVGAHVNLVETSHPAFNPVALSSRNFMDLNTIVHHRRLYDWLGGFDPTLPRLQDWDLMLRYTSVFRPEFVDHCLVYYRRNVAWGQVTTLFVNSGAQDFVNRKTKMRLEEAHVRLNISWPSRQTIVVLAATGDAAAALALGFAALAGAYADVELHADLPTDHPMPDGVTLRSPAPTAARLGALLIGREDHAPMICFGLEDGARGRLAEGLPTSRIFDARMKPDGLHLVDHSDDRSGFHIGSLPPPPSAPIRRGAHPLVTLLADADYREDASVLARAAQTQRVDLLLPPPQHGQTWTLYEAAGGSPKQLPFADGLSASLGRSNVIALTTGIERLGILDFALVTALQSRRCPVAVAPSALGDQWLKSRCAYRIEVNTPDWIASKCPKLLASKDYEKLGAQALKAWQIANHPELVAERIAAFLHINASGTAAPEVLYASQ